MHRRPPHPLSVTTAISVCPSAPCRMHPKQRDRAKLWLNVGYEVNGRFVNLPIGMPVDTMKPTEVKGQNEDWVKFQTARNQLLEALQHYGMSLAPGEEVEVSTLVIRLRRVNEDLEVSKAENEYAVDLASMLMGGSKPTTMPTSQKAQATEEDLVPAAG